MIDLSLLAVKAAALKRSNDFELRAGETGLGVPSHAFPAADVRPLTAADRLAMAAPPPPKAPIAAMPGSRVPRIPGGRGGKAGLVGAGLLAAGLGAGAIGKMRPSPAAAPPEMPPELPGEAPRAVPNVARESLRRTVRSKSREAFGNFWKRMHNRYGRRSEPQ